MGVAMRVTIRVSVGVPMISMTVVMPAAVPSMWLKHTVHRVKHVFATKIDAAAVA